MPNTEIFVSDAVIEVCVPVKGIPVSIEIRRNHLLKEALKESGKAKFRPANPLKVTTLH